VLDDDGNPGIAQVGELVVRLTRGRYEGNGFSREADSRTGMVTGSMSLTWLLRRVLYWRFRGDKPG
jgi:hypothetical protein